MPAVINFLELHIIKSHLINLKHQKMAFYKAVSSSAGEVFFFLNVIVSRFDSDSNETECTFKTCMVI